MSRKDMTTRFLRSFRIVSVVLKSAFDLPRIAPDHLANAKQCQDCSIESPAFVAGHEPHLECNAKSLQHPYGSHRNHHETHEAADDSHDHVECGTHESPSWILVGCWFFIPFTLSLSKGS
jgi:hypothetical protein